METIGVILMGTMAITLTMATTDTVDIITTAGLITTDLVLEMVLTTVQDMADQRWLLPEVL